MVDLPDVLEHFGQGGHDVASIRRIDAGYEHDFVAGEEGEGSAKKIEDLGLGLLGVVAFGEAEGVRAGEGDDADAELSRAFAGALDMEAEGGEVGMGAGDGERG